MNAARQKVAVTSNARMAELSAVVTLGPQSAAALGVPEGTTVDVGVLAYWHRNPLRRLAHAARSRFDERSQLARRYLTYTAELAAEEV